VVPFSNLSNCEATRCDYCAMPTVLYRCPTTGLRVQGRIAGDPTKYDDNTYEAVTCGACRGVHLLNPKTGEILGEGDKVPGEEDDE
jgi:hypothetical protein